MRTACSKPQQWKEHGMSGQGSSLLTLLRGQGRGQGRGRLRVLSCLLPSPCMFGNTHSLPREDVLFNLRQSWALKMHGDRWLHATLYFHRVKDAGSMIKELEAHSIFYIIGEMN